ncbi:ABC transporter permease [Alloscardovia venturai]|uniref:ABC transporter permease n=1 Tax=Alloscardovia venturai TaxID=1769421 RepID=A0ABW2Y5R6_9BIFI
MRMFMNVLRAELLKMSRSTVWVVLVVIPLITAVMGSFNYVNNLGVLTPSWANLWTQHSLFLCYFFSPALIGIICSYLWHFEHQRNNWNIVLTQPVTMTALVVSKIVVASLLFGFVLSMVGIFYWESGRILRVPGNFPPEFGLWLVRGWLAGIAVISVQSIISLFVRNFAAPVAIAMVLGIAGLGVTAEGLELYYPFSLLQISMNSNGTSGLSAHDVTTFIIMTMCYIVIPIIISVAILRKKDVDSK